MKNVLSCLVHTTTLEWDHIRVDDRRCSVSTHFPFRYMSMFKLTHRHQPTSTNARQRSHEIQKDDIMRNSTTKTAQKKSNRGRKETSTPTENIGEAPVQRLESRAGDQIRGGQPGGCVGRVELRADQRVGRRGDRSIKSRQKDVRKDCFQIN